MSICRQSYRLFEIIIVDSFSTDGTLDIARTFGAEIIRHGGNAAIARNKGVAHSTGDYVLFLDSDQVLSPEVIKECLEECERKGAGMVTIPETFVGRGFWSNCSAVWKNQYRLDVGSAGSSGVRIRGRPRFFVKKLIRAQLLDDTLIWGEDLDLHERLKKSNMKETTCSSRVFHNELTDFSGLLRKSLHYGRFLPKFMTQTNTRVALPMLQVTFLTLGDIVRNAHSPLIIVGCTLLLCLKACSIMLVLPVGFLSKRR